MDTGRLGCLCKLMLPLVAAVEEWATVLLGGFHDPQFHLRADRVVSDLSRALDLHVLWEGLATRRADAILAAGRIVKDFSNDRDVFVWVMPELPNHVTPSVFRVCGYRSEGPGGRLVKT